MDTPGWWDAFHSRYQRVHEWYLEGDEAAPTLMELLPTCSSVLHLGAGTSDLGRSIESTGRLAVVDIDFSSQCMQYMGETQPTRQHIVMDAARLAFAPHSFDCAVDKGTLDAVLANRGSATLAIAQSIISSALLAVVPGGTLIFISIIGTDERLMDLQHAFDRATDGSHQPAPYAADGPSLPALGSNPSTIPRSGASRSRLPRYMVTRHSIPLPPLEKPDQACTWMYVARPVVGHS